MDLGGLGLDGLMVGSENRFVPSSSSSDPEDKQKWCGSGFLKNGRSSTVDDDDLRGSKMAKIASSDASRAMLLQQQRNNTPPPLFPSSHEQMLSFSSPKSEPNAALGYSSNYHHHTLSSYSRNNAGGGGGGGAFMETQWMELEQQALIYKYITANVPVPSHLLIPIRKSLDSSSTAAFSHFSSNSLLIPTNPLGWGGFHLGYSNSTDPEPGRCRRTDGKKWRCSRDAVMDQKYCERHMNRGRHRSRKPVEGLKNSGHHHHSLITTSSAATLNTSTTNSSSSSKLHGSNNNINGSILVQGNSDNTLSFGHTLASDASAANSINRMFMNNNNNSSNKASVVPIMLPPTLDLKQPKEENPFMIRQFPSYEESSSSSSRNHNNEFGLVTSDSLLNPKQQHSLWNFIDDCPKTTHSLDNNNRTHLSISIPTMVNGSEQDFISFNSSQNDEKLTLSPLRLSREFELEPIQMGLGVGSYDNESNTRQANWIPITWESSNPLGEVLKLSSNNSNNNNNNNASDGCCWDNSPNSIGSSPTGVLQQRTGFGSVSNSSAGSSPRGEGTSLLLCNDLVGSTNA